jgi:hypothetical protein
MELAVAEERPVLLSSPTLYPRHGFCPQLMSPVLSESVPVRGTLVGLGQVIAPAQLPPPSGLLGSLSLDQTIKGGLRLLPGVGSIFPASHLADDLAPTVWSQPISACSRSRPRWAYACSPYPCPRSGLGCRHRSILSTNEVSSFPGAAQGAKPALFPPRELLGTPTTTPSSSTSRSSTTATDGTAPWGCSRP